jgi:hypothetical protein
VKSDVDVDTNLFDWFDQRVRVAHETVGANLSRDGEMYLSALLVDRVRAPAAEPHEGLTLAEMHLRASQASPSEQARVYRELGDRSLYVVGYFEESLARSTVGPRYYLEMGAAAYARADVVSKRFFADAFGDIFAELARRFGLCVRVLQEVRRVVDDQPDALLRLYERWRATGSATAAERLRALGLVLPPRDQES